MLNENIFLGKLMLPFYDLGKVMLPIQQMGRK